MNIIQAFFQALFPSSTWGAPERQSHIPEDQRPAVEQALQRYFRRHGGNPNRVTQDPERALRTFQRRNRASSERGLGPRTVRALRRYGFTGGPQPEPVRDTFERTQGSRGRRGANTPTPAAPERREYQGVFARPSNPLARVPWNLRSTVRQAQSSLEANLRESGRQVQPGRIYAVQIDRTNDDSSDLGQLRGRTVVFRGGTDGELEMMGTFASSSQPSCTNARFSAAQNYGVAHIRPGMYTVSRTREGVYGGAFRIGGAAADRDANRNGVIDASERGLSGPRGRAGGILLHSSAYGSAGCQTFHDFDAFAQAVAQGRGSTFDYLLIRM